MADSALQTLLSTKAALDLGLVTQNDFDAVKSAFLRAQQLKAAVDVGVIRPEDYEATKAQFLESLIGAAPSPAPTPSAGPPPIMSLANSRSAPVLKPPSPAPLASAAPSPAAYAPALASAAPSPAAYVPPPVPAPRPRPVSRPASPAVGGSTSPTKPSGVLHDVPIQLPKLGSARNQAAGATSMSGISVNEDSVNLYYHIRSKSAFRWALWRIDDEGSTVIIAAVGEPDSTYDDFLEALPESDCRYGVYDYQERTPDGQVLNKLVFLNWAPDVARVKSKMMYASTKDYFKGLLDGISVEFQASELDEINEQEVSAAVRALKRS